MVLDKAARVDPFTLRDQLSHSGVQLLDVRTAAEFESAGVTRATVLDGGLSAWLATGGPVQRERERWALERQVRLVAGSLVLTGILGSVAVPRLKWLAGGIGAGLTFAALSNTCMMGNLLSRLPHNRKGDGPDCSDVVAALVRGERGRRLSADSPSCSTA